MSDEEKASKDLGAFWRDAKGLAAGMSPIWGKPDHGPAEDEGRIIIRWNLQGGDDWLIVIVVVGPEGVRAETSKPNRVEPVYVECVRMVDTLGALQAWAQSGLLVRTEVGSE